MYEMNINAGVTGVEQVERLGAATDKQTERTKRVDDAIKNYIASNDRLGAKLLETEKAEIRLEQLREQHRMQTERLAAATDKHTGSQERLNSAMRSHVTDVQAASASIRAFEGNLPIRAVEQFTTKMLGMGGAFQALFPLVGVIGVAAALEKGIEKLGEMYNAWNPVLTAQEKSLKLLKDSNSEFDSLIKKSDQYRLDTYQREHGRAARLRLEAGEASGDAAYGDAARVRYIQGRIAAQESIVNAPSGLMGTPGMMGGGVIATGPSDSAREVARTTLRGLYAQLEEAELQQRVDNLKAADLRAKATEAEDKKAAHAENLAIELRKRAAEATMAMYFGKSLEGKAAFQQVKLRIEERDAIRRNPTEASNIRGSYTLLRTAAFGSTADAIARRDMDEGNGLDDVSRSSLAHIIRTDLADERHNSPELRSLISPGRPAVPAGYRSPGQELRDVRNSESRYMSLARVSGQLSGQSERDQIEGLYAKRLQLADQELRALLRIADAKNDLVAREDALDQAQQKRYDAALEREKAILEMTLRTKQEFEQTFTGLIHAIGSGNLGGFITRRLESLGDEILMKIGGKIFEKILEASRPKTISIRDVIGGAAKDPLIDSTDQNTRATDDNTRALRDLTGVIVTGGGGGGGTIGFPSGSGGPGVMGGASSTIMYGLPGAVSGLGAAGGALGKIIPAIGIGIAAYSIIKGLLGNSRVNRARDISNTLNFSRFLDPVSINATMTTQGGYADFDRFGGVRGSDVSPFPSIDQPYIDHFHDVTVPGRSQYGQGGSTVNVTVQAMDARSVIDRHQDIGDAIVRAIDHGHTGLQEKLRSY